MHILITGGAGFIGSNLAAYHLARGDTVHAVDDLSTGSIENIRTLFDLPGFTFTQANILVWDQLQNAVRQTDRIYHLAAIVGVKKVLEDPRAVMAVNVAATERVFRAIDAVRPQAKILIASSSEVYGFNTNSCFAETDDLVFRSAGRLRWCYAITKLSDEYLAYAFMKKSNISVSIVRLFNTIGLHQTGKYGMVVPTFVHQAVNNLPITIYGDGTQTRSFCDVRDTVTALDLLLSTPDANGEIVNVGNDFEISITDLAKLIVERAQSSSALHYQTYEQACGLDFEDHTHRRPLLDKLRKLTGFKNQWSLTQSLDLLIEQERLKR